MTATTRTDPLPEVSPEILTFAAEAGVGDYLYPVLEMTRRVFPSARRFDVLLADDPEIPDDRHIVLELEVPLSVPEAMAADRRWSEGLFATCPTPLVCVFRLSTSLVSWTFAATP